MSASVEFDKGMGREENVMSSLLYMLPVTCDRQRDTDRLTANVL